MATGLRNNLRASLGVTLLCGCLTILGACTTASKSVLNPDRSHGPYTLKLVGHINDIEKNRYYSHSHTKTSEGGELINQKDEIVEFTVATLTTKTEESRLYQTVETIEKDGIVDLHDFAFPEKDEKIEMIYTPTADVEFVKGYPDTSVFYVPPFSLPSAPVNVGETWTMKRSWQSLHNGMPLELDLLTVLKGVYDCPGAGKCADLEISGQVFVSEPFRQSINYTSEISGRLLFSITKGTLVWSEVKSQEQLILQETAMKIQSCIRSQLIAPSEWSLDSGALKCDPLKDKVALLAGMRD